MSSLLLPLLRTLLMPVLACVCIGVNAAPSQAMTVYGEAPKYPADFQHFDYVNPDAPKGGSLSRASMEIGQFNYITPYVDQGTGVAQVNDWVYSPLAFRSLDEPYTVYGLVAQKMERDPDGLWVRFYLNPKARFADDTAITAEDVAYTYNLLMTKGSLSYRMLYGEVQDVVIEGPLQVRFNFKSNQNRTLALDLASMRILPEHWWKTRDFSNGGGFEAPLGSGPYQADRWPLAKRRVCQGKTRRSPGLCLQPAKSVLPGPPSTSGAESVMGFRVDQQADDAQLLCASTELLPEKRNGRHCPARCPRTANP